jgi:hypothetical protein
MRLPTRFVRKEYLLLLGLGAALLPFFLLAAYCHPAADDFWLTNLVREKGMWAAQWEIRQTWSGRYTSMLLASMNPLVFGSISAYKAMAFILLALLVLAVHYFVAAFLGRALPRRQSALAALVFLALYLGFMPVVSQVVYWLSGALSYQAAHIALLLLFGRLLRPVAGSAFTPGFFLLNALLVLFIAGLNETAMALLLYLLAGLVLLSWWGSGRLSKPLLGLLGFAVLGAAVVVLAPGNAIRSADFPQQGRFFFSLAYAGAVAINNSFNWLTSGPVLLFTLLFLPFCLRVQAWPLRWQNVHPFFTWLFFYGALVTCFFVSYYSKGGAAVPRVQDTIYLVFLTGWFGNVFHTVRFLAANGWQAPALRPYAVSLLWVLGLLWLLLSPASHIRTAWSDLASGRAARYDQEMKARYALLRQSDCQVCPIPAIQHVPATIFFEEIPADTTWKNRYFSEYFGKKLMVLEGIK